MENNMPGPTLKEQLEMKSIRIDVLEGDNVSLNNLITELQAQHMIDTKQLQHEMATRNLAANALETINTLVNIIGNLDTK